MTWVSEEHELRVGGEGHDVSAEHDQGALKRHQSEIVNVHGRSEKCNSGVGYDSHLPHVLHCQDSNEAEGARTAERD